MDITRVNGTQEIINSQQIGRVSNTSFANVGIVSNSEEEDLRVEISDEGRRMGAMMEQAGRMGPPHRERMNEIKSSLDELNLDKLDVESMTDEEIDDVTSQIYDVLESYRPAEVTESPIDIASMSADEKREFVTGFKNNADGMMEAIGKASGMMQGKPPMGGPKQAGGKGDIQQTAINAYQSLEIDSEEEEEELSIIESILAALEEADTEADDYTVLDDAINGYLTKGLV